MLSVNTQKCRQVAQVLKTLSVKDAFYNRKFLSFNADRETKLGVYLMSTAICHQTHSLYHKELNLWGWEYMEYAFLKMIDEGSALINPSYLNFCSTSEIENRLKSLFSADGNSEHSTLDRISERAGMLLQICAEIKTNYGSSVSNLIDEAGGTLLNGKNGLYESLSRFDAFSDALRKKITFFVKIAGDAGVLFIKDQQHIIPIMDYHMQRVLLRLGCIDFNHSELKLQLIHKKSQESDTEVRTLCIEALRIISNESGHEILKMNDFFWPLGRSCCNATTLCHDKVCAKEPCTFFSMTNASDHNRCPFESVCKGFEDESFRSLWEPMVNTHYY